MNIIFDATTKDHVIIRLKAGTKILAEKRLTISQDFDNMLITALDRILRESKIDRACLKTAEIVGKREDKALWAMILKTVKQAATL